MRSATLDNPFWAALSSIHRDIAQRAGDVARYPAEYAPFLGVASAEVEVTKRALERLVPAGESVYLLGVVPRVPAGWVLEAQRPLAQLVCESRLEVADGPEPLLLTSAHRQDLLALTRLVYPHYFRERTQELGRYLGIYEAGRLAAMVGERLGSESARELSAICTDPDFLGRGYARRLTALHTNQALAEGKLAFLHVSHDNTRAKTLYERLGFRMRREIGFFSLRRANQ